MVVVLVAMAVPVVVNVDKYNVYNHLQLENEKKINSIPDFITYRSHII